MFYNLVEYNFLSVKGGHPRLQSSTLETEIKQWGVGTMLFLIGTFVSLSYQPVVLDLRNIIDGKMKYDVMIL